jgi:hypothetical protein
MRTAIAILVLVASVYSAHAFGMGKLGFIFGREGASNTKKAVVVASCPSPTAPNGVVDLSTCSNAYYVALIF